VTTAAWESVDASAVETAWSLGASPLRAFRDVVARAIAREIREGRGTETGGVDIDFHTGYELDYHHLE